MDRRKHPSQNRTGWVGREDSHTFISSSHDGRLQRNIRVQDTRCGAPLSPPLLPSHSTHPCRFSRFWCHALAIWHLFAGLTWTFFGCNLGWINLVLLSGLEKLHHHGNLLLCQPRHGHRTCVDTLVCMFNCTRACALLILGVASPALLRRTACQSLGHCLCPRHWNCIRKPPIRPRN
jgi:hypothetical protein